MTSKPRVAKRNVWFAQPVRERRGVALAVFFIFAPRFLFLILCSDSAILKRQNQEEGDDE
jgi:hypothetical protein